MDAPKKIWKSILDMFQDALAHEKKVTAWIYGLNTLAIEEKDYATQSMLRWFIDEQVEEEANCNEAISALTIDRHLRHGHLHGRPAHRQARPELIAPLRPRREASASRFFMPDPRKAAPRPPCVNSRVPSPSRSGAGRTRGL